MVDTTRYKVLALWFGAAALVVAVFAGAGFLVLSMESGVGTVNDLGVSNDGNATRNVTIEATPANATVPAFARNVTLAPGQSASYEDPLAAGERYALAIAVEGRPGESRNVTGTGDACGLRVSIRENGTVSVNTLCA